MLWGSQGSENKWELCCCTKCGCWPWQRNKDLEPWVIYPENRRALLWCTLLAPEWFNISFPQWQFVFSTAHTTESLNAIHQKHVWDICKVNEQVHNNHCFIFGKMHVLDTNRCCFAWLLWFFSSTLFWFLLILFFPLRHCSMDFIWIKVAPVFSVLMAGLYCCGCLWQHHPEGSIIPDTCPVFSGLFWVLELGSHCPSMVERKGGDFLQAIVWACGFTSFMNSLTSRFYTEPTSSAAPCPVDSWELGLHSEGRGQWFLNFLSQWSSPVFQLPGLPREEHFPCKLTPPPPIPCPCLYGEVKLKKIFCSWQKSRQFFVQVSEKSPLRMFT